MTSKGFMFTGHHSAVYYMTSGGVMYCCWKGGVWVKSTFKARELIAKGWTITAVNNFSFKFKKGANHASTL